ncbi:WD repeat-containing protein WRAP73 [Vitis vinifera]|uniref:WD repeat-containing protein WRAP73 n=1 Tax=Vitis vinifera TaxID=29760 RepID=A0A438CU32_VITVI|nr:WD repeat-containing protein WRAP73 [Vitis vinifera]
MIQAWSLTQPEWTCKIDEGPAGIAYARWSPDSRHILTTSDFQLRLTVWSLVNTACVHVQWPKHASKGVSFTQDGKFAAICTRRDCKDYINLLSCHTWEIMGVFAVDTLDLADIEWSPDDSAIVIWDSPLEYKVLIYSPDGRCLSKYQAYESGLGVKTVSWSPCGQFLAVGSYDQMLRVLNHLTWKTFAEFLHLSTVRAPCYAAVFKEVDEPLQLDMSELCLSDDFIQGNSGVQEPGGEPYPWVNKQFLWFCRSVGVSDERQERNILKILMNMEARGRYMSSLSSKKRGERISPRKDRALRKLSSFVNYDGCGGKAAS